MIVSFQVALEPGVHLMAISSLQHVAKNTVIDILWNKAPEISNSIFTYRGTAVSNLGYTYPEGYVKISRGTPVQE